MMVGVKRRLLSIKDILAAPGFGVKGVFPEENSVEPVNAASIQIESVSIDSRAIHPGALFVPLKGENTDGHRYIRDAAQRGAAVSFTSEKYWKENRNALEAITDEFGIRFLVVDDPLTALQHTAEHYLDGFKELKRVGVTGSSGKTTTKELIGALLPEIGATAVSKGNLNSEIGVCLAAFDVESSQDFAVFELGMNRVGEMDILTRIVKPDVSVITNIGTAHIGYLGSQENIALEKKKILSLLTEEGVGFIFEDEPYFDLLASEAKGTIRPYGPKSLDGFEHIQNLGLDGMVLGWKGHEIQLALPGEINISNACAAIEVALHFGVEEEQIVKGLEQARPLFGRGEIRRGQVDIICDYYNANPESMVEALVFLLSLDTEGRKIALLGDMKELGFHSGQAHRMVGEKLLSSPVDLVFLIGEEMQKICSLLSPAYQDRVFWTDNPVEMIKKLKNTLREGDVLLLKGSRASALEEIEKEL